ncbi:MAG TPA: HEAT repeat domain-containing protein, partial [Planctomycetaceae bacterium]|nr:HEAT repeat domain-containing protein [Planctomycetaceae bacterium]
MSRFFSVAFLILTFVWLSIIHAESTLASSLQEDGADLSDVESLLGRLEKGSIEERIDAVNQLGALGPYAQSAVDQIVKAMSTDDLALKYECIAALGQIGPLAHDASDSLTPMLTADSNLFQVAALESLRRIGTASPDAVALIRKLSQDSDASAATSAIRCLVMIAGENDELVRNSIPRLVKALGDKRTEVRNEAVLTLVEIGPAAVSAVTAVLSDTDYHVRLSACNILGQFGSDAASAVPGLLPRLEDKED